MDNDTGPQDKYEPCNITKQLKTKTLEVFLQSSFMQSSWNLAAKSWNFWVLLPNLLLQAKPRDRVNPGENKQEQNKKPPPHPNPHIFIIKPVYIPFYKALQYQLPSNFLREL